jgi:hypothetical protein
MGADEQSAVIHLPEAIFSFEIEGKFSLKASQERQFIKKYLPEHIIIPEDADDRLQPVVMKDDVEIIEYSLKRFTGGKNKV